MEPNFNRASESEAKLVLALDVSTRGEALKFVESFAGFPIWMKVGLELFCSAGPEIVGKIRTSSFPVFLDLKFHDIPNTVAQAVRAVSALEASMLTLHTAGGEEMLKAARRVRDEIGDEEAPLLMGVTVLTSSTEKDLGGSSLRDLVLSRAFLAKKSGLDGVVCSGHEVEEIKNECGKDFLCLCPGIRFSDTSHDDQSRVMSPDLAVKKGADFLVMGRPIRRAENPLHAAKRALKLMKGK